MNNGIGQPGQHANPVVTDPAYQQRHRRQQEVFRRYTEVQEVVGDLRHANGGQRSCGHHQSNEHQRIQRTLAWPAHERPATPGSG